MAEQNVYDESVSRNQDVLDVTEIAIPPECTVVIYNDDFTTMEFVTEILVSVFDKQIEEAEIIMKKVHVEGSGIAGVYTYDIAVTKAEIATSRAKKNGFPLRIEVKN